MSDELDQALEREWPVTVTLKHPVVAGSKTIDSLTFRRGKLGDLKGMRIDGMPSVSELLLIASRLCGEPVAILEKIDGDDGEEVLELALVFFTRCLGAGRGR